MNLHHYLQSDIETEFIFDVYSRFIYRKQKGGNKVFKNGNKLQTYDFVKAGHNLFIGECLYDDSNQSKRSGNILVWSCKKLRPLEKFEAYVFMENYSFAQRIPTN